MSENKETNNEHLIKEYESCWQGIHHNNTRLWSSASILIPASIAALGFTASRVFLLNGGFDLFVIQTVASSIIIVLCFYLNIFNSLKLLDRIEYYRLEEIEKLLGLWRARYHIYLHELPDDLKDSSACKETEEAEKQILKRLQIKNKEGLARHRKANESFEYIIYIIIIAAFLLSLGAWLIYFFGPSNPTGP